MLKKLKLALKGLREEFALCAHSAGGHYNELNKRLLFPRLTALYWMLGSPLRFQPLRELVCSKAGHSLVEEGFAGPESGCMEMSCTRCGESWGRTLY